MNNNITVVKYLYNCLKEEGIGEVFGVPGDYNFPLIDELELDKEIKFIACRNELNAGYATDGYARIKGIGAVITTFGVGELSACNAIAGSYAENVPVIHIVGAPKTADKMEHKKLHHTLLDGNFQVFKEVYKNLTCYVAEITPENAMVEIKKAINKAKELKQPVYLLLAKDVVNKPIIDCNMLMEMPKTNANIMNIVLKEINDKITKATKPIIISGYKVCRYKLQEHVLKLAEKMNVPVFTMMMGKGSFDETNIHYAGLYVGELGDSKVKDYVESSDCIISIGEVFADFNTGLFTNKFNPNYLIDIQHNYVSIAMARYDGILIKDLLEQLTNTVQVKDVIVPKYIYPYDFKYNKLKENITSKYCYSRFQEMMKENDIVIVESGTLIFGAATMRLPKNTTYIAQTQWGSIGYATPATLGASIAEPNRRVILFTGEGSHQLTTQALSTMLYNNCKPIIFILNNNGYTIERYLNKPKDSEYNDLPIWNYTELPKTFGGDAFTAKVFTNEELNNAINNAEKECQNRLCLIEIVCSDIMDGPTIAMNVKGYIEKQNEMIGK